MSTNKRIRRSPAKTTQGLLSEPQAPAAKKPRSLKAKAEDLEKTVHRLEVEIAATTRLAQESKLRNRNFVPPPERSGFAQSKRRLTHAQSRDQQRKVLMQVLEFSITGLLIAGACAGLYQWWLSRGF